MNRKPYTVEEKAVIVARGEAKLGKQHFFGHVTEPIAPVTVLQTLEEKVEDEEAKFHAMYTDLFAKAIVNLRNGQDLRGIIR
jgi:hypothetical protein